jgi:CubicO group peptidase (beta-lactamase class C family)
LLTAVHAWGGGEASASLRLEHAERAGPDLSAVDAVLKEAVSRGVFPGAVLAVGRRTGLVHLRAVGRLSSAPASAAVQADTIYDLASLTKVVATTMAAMVLVDQGRLDLDSSVGKHLPAFTGAGRDKARVHDLLAHSAGLPSWAPLYKEVQGKQAYLSRIAELDLEYEPGTGSRYSDLGMILLGAVVERVTGEGLDSWVAQHIYRPLSMKDTLFTPGRDLRARIAPTTECPWRRRLIQGEVRDENAYAMGGVAGHAGLFGTAPDLARLAELLLGDGVFAKDPPCRHRAPFHERVRRARLPPHLGLGAGAGRSLGGRALVGGGLRAPA